MGRHSASTASYRRKPMRPSILRRKSSRIRHTGDRRRGYEYPLPKLHVGTNNGEQDTSNRPKIDYKPAAFTWPFLLTLIVAVVVLLALMGVALHMLPAEEESSKLKLRMDSLSSIDEMGMDRQDQSIPPSITRSLDLKIPTTKYSNGVREEIILQKYRRRNTSSDYLEHDTTSCESESRSLAMFYTSAWPSIGTQTVIETQPQVTPKPSPVPIASTVTTEWTPETTMGTTIQETSSPQLIITWEPSAPRPTSPGGGIGTSSEDTPNTEGISPEGPKGTVKTGEVMATETIKGQQSVLGESSLRPKIDVGGTTQLTNTRSEVATRGVSDTAHIIHTSPTNIIGLAGPTEKVVVTQTTDASDTMEGARISGMRTVSYTGGIVSVAGVGSITEVVVVVLDGSESATFTALALSIPKGAATVSMDPNESIPISSAIEIIDPSGSTLATIDAFGAVLATRIQTLTNSAGIPTSTETQLIPTLSPLSTSTNPDGTVFIIDVELVDTDSNTLTGANLQGQLTVMSISALSTPVTPAPSLPIATIAAPSGVTPTTSPLAGSSQTATPNEVKVYFITEGQYFIGMFLPTLLTTIISIPIGILERTLRLFHPFHVLTRKEGARGAESLLARSGSYTQVISAFTQYFEDSAILVLAIALSMATVLLTPFSAGAINIQIRNCPKDSPNSGNCAITLGITRQATVATIVLLAFVLVMLILVAVLLRNWKSGVASNPWCLVGMASLSTHPALQRIVSEAPTNRRMIPEKLKSKMFRTQPWENGPMGMEYGICPIGDGPIKSQRKSILPASNKKTKRRRPPRLWLPMAVRYWARCLVLVFLCGTLALIVYYESGMWNNSFEDFMDSQSFGVRFLFASIGVIISIFWERFARGVAILSPFRILARGPTTASRSILLTPPIDATTGIWAGIRRRDFFLVVAASSAFMSEFLPMLLANVPASSVTTKVANEACSRTAVIILGWMILVLLGSFFIRWPKMPADPTTILGMMYYICDPLIIEKFEGMSTMEKKERNTRVRKMGLKYKFGEIMDIPGRKRIGVYIVEDNTSQPV